MCAVIMTVRQILAIKVFGLFLRQNDKTTHCTPLKNHPTLEGGVVLETLSVFIFQPSKSKAEEF